MMIWRKKPTLEELNERSEGSIASVLGIEFTAVTDDTLEATMPVDERTRQPYGILHGGASVVLAESVGSTASNLLIDNTHHIGVGLEINANHLRPVKEGVVKAICSPLHIGSTTHVWDIRIYDRHEKMNCVCRLTVAIVPKR